MSWFWSYLDEFFLLVVNSRIMAVWVFVFYVIGIVEVSYWLYLGLDYIYRFLKSRKEGKKL